MLVNNKKAINRQTNSHREKKKRKQQGMLEDP